MEWKWVKSLLIFLFLILNCFLGYQVYQRNAVSTISEEAEKSLKVVLESRNITCNFEFNNVVTKKYMKKINISNEKNIEEKFIPISLIDNQKAQYTGRNRETIPLSSVLVNFVRETKLTDVKIDGVALGYYPEISQIDKNILSGEATPAWLIKTEKNGDFIYSAYLGDRIN